MQRVLRGNHSKLPPKYSGWVRSACPCRKVHSRQPWIFTSRFKRRRSRHHHEIQSIWPSVHTSTSSSYVLAVLPVIPPYQVSGGTFEFRVALRGDFPLSSFRVVRDPAEESDPCADGSYTDLFGVVSVPNTTGWAIFISVFV